MNFSFNSTQNICPAVHIALDNKYLYNNITADAGPKINAVASEAFGSFQGDMENVKTFGSTYKDELVQVGALRLLATAVPVLSTIDNGFTPNEFNPLNKTHYKMPRAEKPVQARPAEKKMKTSYPKTSAQYAR